MNIKSISIDDYSLIKDRKITHLSLKYSLFILLILGGLFLICRKIEYTKFLKMKGIVIDNDLVSISLLSSNVEKVLNSELYIDDIKYDVRVFNISKKEVIDTFVYQNVILNINLDERINHANMEIDMIAVLDKKSLINYIYSVMKGG